MGLKAAGQLACHLIHWLSRNIPPLGEAAPVTVSLTGREPCCWLLDFCIGFETYRHSFMKSSLFPGVQKPCLKFECLASNLISSCSKMIQFLSESLHYSDNTLVSHKPPKDVKFPKGSFLCFQWISLKSTSGLHSVSSAVFPLQVLNMVPEGDYKYQCAGHPLSVPTATVSQLLTTACPGGLLPTCT